MRYFLIFIILLSFINCGKEKTTVKEEPSLLAKGKPGMNTWNLPEPGESDPIKRPYNIAPPLIPHSVKDFVINRKQNDCLNCHLEGIKISEGHIATKVSEFHFVNEYTGEKTKETVIGMKYNCVQCHVPQTNVK